MVKARQFQIVQLEVGQRFPYHTFQRVPYRRCRQRWPKKPTAKEPSSCGDVSGTSKQVEGLTDGLISPLQNTNRPQYEPHLHNHSPWCKRQLDTSTLIDSSISAIFSHGWLNSSNWLGTQHILGPKLMESPSGKGYSTINTFASWGWIKSRHEHLPYFFDGQHPAPKWYGKMSIKENCDHNVTWKECGKILRSADGNIDAYCLGIFMQMITHDLSMAHMIFGYSIDWSYNF